MNIVAVDRVSLASQYIKANYGDKVVLQLQPKNDDALDEAFKFFREQGLTRPQCMKLYDGDLKIIVVDSEEIGMDLLWKIPQSCETAIYVDGKFINCNL